MIEEKVNIEQEIYELCEQIENINNENQKQIKKIVDMDKQNYVTKKIKKIIRYINGIELALELDNDKNIIKEKLNIIYTAEQTISDILADDPENVDEINKRINSIINMIKEIEPLVTSMFDLSIYLQKNGIKNNVALYRTELNNLNDEISSIKENTEEEFRVIKETKMQELSEINKKQEEVKNDIDNQFVDFTRKMEEFDKSIKQKDEEISALKEESDNKLKNIEESYKTKFEELEKKANQDFDKLKEDIGKKDEKISELIGLIGNKANIGEYKSNADKAHTERIRWQIATVIIFGLAFLLMGIITYSTKDYNITTLARYIVSVILLGMSGYTGKQASNQRKDEVYYRKQQLELSSIDVYLDNMPETTRIEIKKELSSKIFGQASETYKSKYDDNTNETLDKIVKLVENLSNNITKNNR